MRFYTSGKYNVQLHELTLIFFYFYFNNFNWFHGILSIFVSVCVCLRKASSSLQNTLKVSCVNDCVYIEKAQKKLLKQLLYFVSSFFFFVLFSYRIPRYSFNSSFFRVEKKRKLIKLNKLQFKVR